jgi:hypothetical protein
MSVAVVATLTVVEYRIHHRGGRRARTAAQAG